MIANLNLVHAPTVKFQIICILDPTISINIYAGNPTLFHHLTFVNAVQAKAEVRMFKSRKSQGQETEKAV